MPQVDTGEAIGYGASLIGYAVAVYFGGGFLTTVRFWMFGSGTGGPLSSGNPVLLLVGVTFLVVGYLVLIVGTIGLLYKLVADGVARGIDGSTTAASMVEE